MSIRRRHRDKTSRLIKAGLAAVAAGALAAALLSLQATARPAASARQVPGEAYVSMGFGVFMHYGLATFVGKTPWDYDPHDVPATVYDPRNFDPDQWMRAIKVSGAKYIILTTKHHDGFVMWPSDCRSSISTHLAYPAWRIFNCIEPPWYGPVCLVVWEGKPTRASLSRFIPVLRGTGTS